MNSDSPPPLELTLLPISNLERCKQLAESSMGKGGEAAMKGVGQNSQPAASGFANILSSMPSIGQSSQAHVGVSKAGSHTTMTDHDKRSATDLEADIELAKHRFECASIPFTEIVGHVAGIFDTTDKPLDRNLNALENSSKSLDRNLDALVNVDGKLNRNYHGIENNLKAIDSNYEALARIYSGGKDNSQLIKEKLRAIRRNYLEIKQISAQLDGNLEIVECDFDQLSNVGKLELGDGEAKEDYRTVGPVSPQIDKNLLAIREDLKVMTGIYQAIRQNKNTIQLVLQGVDGKLVDNLVENYRVTKRSLGAANGNHQAIARVGDKIDRYHSMMLSGFRYMVDKIHATKAETTRRVDGLEQIPNTSEKEKAVSQIVAFLEIFSSELDGVRNLNRDRLIEKLESKDGMLSLLKSVSIPAENHLYNDLKNIIKRSLAIPNSSEDKMSLVVLDLLHSGTDIYVSVLYSLVRSYVFLAVEYYEKNDVDKYNQYLSELEVTARNFVDSLIGTSGNVGLLDEVSAINYRVKELDFIKEDREYLLDILANRRLHLQSIKSNLKELVEHLPVASPTMGIGFDFSSSNVSSGIGKWKNGGKVSYAIHSEKKDGSNHVKVSDWVSHNVHDRAMPVLDIGAASTGERRSIFRRFSSEDKPELVASIEDNNQSEFRDIGRDLYNAVLEKDEQVALKEIELLINDGADVNVEYRNEGYITNIAAKQGNSSIMSSLIKNGADIEARDVEGNTPIHIVTQNGFKSLVEILIDSGADVNAGNDLNSTPVHAAARNGDAETITLLLQKGARTNSTNSDGYTPLHAAAASGRDNIVDLLLSLRPEMDIESTTDQGFTPLHLASAAGHDSAVQSLLRNKKIKVNSRGRRGITPLHLASMSGNLSTLIALLAAQGDDQTRVNEQTDDGLSALHLAIYFRKDKVVAELLKMPDLEVSSTTRDGLTPLHIASSDNRPEFVTALLNKGASPDDRDHYNHAPLHLAAERGHLAVVRALTDAPSGASLNVRREDGRTPLQLAIIENRPDVVQYLIEKGARIHTKDNKGASSLVYAIQTGKSDMVKVMVEAYKKEHYNLDGALHGAAQSGILSIVKFLVQELNIQDFNPRNKNGNTPIHFAALQGRQDIVSYLADAGADLASKDNRGDNIMHFAALGGNKALIEYLVAKGVKVEGADSYNVTPLHLASFNGHKNSIKYLLKAGNETSINLADNNGNTALHYLAASRRSGDSYAEFVKYMAENRAKIELPNKEGYTPLLMFARSGKWSVVRFLAKKYASPDFVNIRDQDGWSPVFWAARYGNLDMVKMLIDEMKADYKSPDKQRSSILHVAILSGNLDLLKYLVEEKRVNINLFDNSSSIPLHLAAELGHLEMVEYLLKNSRSTKNALDKNEFTPLMRAAEKRKWDVVDYLIKSVANKRIPDKNKNYLAHKCAESGKLEIMKSLNDLDLSTKNSRGESPLHLAVMNDNLDIIKYLVGDKSVSSIQDSDKLGNTPLHYAAMAGKLHTVKYLTEKGSDPSMKNAADKNPCDLTSDLSIAKYFIDENNIGYNSDAFSVVANGSLGILKYLVEKQHLNPGMVDDDGKSLLHHAATQGKINMVKYLVGTEKVDLNPRDKSSKTPRYYAIMNSHPEVVDYLDEMDSKQVIDYGDQTIFDVAKERNVKMFDFLIDKMVDIDQRVSSGKTKLESVLAAQDPDSGNTPLHYAVTLGNLRLVKRLVGFGANTNSRNANGKTPLESVAKDQQEIAKYLLEKDRVDDIFTATRQGNLAIVKDFIEVKKASIDARDKDNKTVLECAIDHDHLEIIKYLIEERGQSIESKDGTGWSPLHWAAQNGHLSTVKYLVEKGGNVKAKTSDNKAPLDLAIAKNNTELIKYLIDERGVAYEGDIFTAATDGQLGMVRYFVEVKKVNPDTRNKEGWNPLHKAAGHGQLGVVKYLIEERGQSIESKDSTGWSPLHWAVMNDHLSTVKYLAEKGGNVDAKTDKSNTPLDLAIAECHLELIKYLIDERGVAFDGDLFTAARDGQLGMVRYFVEVKKLNPDTRDKDGWNALHWAAGTDQLSVIKYLIEEQGQSLESKDKTDYSTLHWAAYYGHLKTVKYLAEKGAIINAETEDNKTPLDLAIDQEHMEIIKYLIDERGVKYGGDIYSAAEAGHLVMVKYLVEVKKLNPDIRDKDGANPLHWAASGGQLNVVKYLIEERGQSVEPIDSTGNNALHWAADEGRLNTFKYLAERGADINAKTEDDETPLDMANAKGYLEVIRYLIEEQSAVYEKDIFTAAKKGQFGVIKYLIEVKGQSVNSRDASGGTLLHKAVDFGRMKIVKYLVDEKHVDLNAKNNFKSTPSHAAAERGYLDILKYLAGKGADINAEDSSNNSPLVYAIDNNHEEVIKYLLDERGVVFEGGIFKAAEKGKLGVVKYFIDVKKQDPDSRDKKKWNALHWATAYGQLGIVEYLIGERAQLIESLDSIGWTPLLFAAYNGHLSVVKYLVEHRANLAAKDTSSRTPLSLAIDHDHLEIIKYLIDERGVAYEGDIFTAAKKGQLGMVRYFLGLKKSNYNTRDKDGWTPLHWAATNGRLGTVKYLAEKGADVSARTNADKSPLDLAIDQEHMEIIKYLIDERGLKYGGDIYSAAKGGDLVMVRYFVEVKKSNYNTRDKDGWTPLHWAATNGRLGTVKYLAEKGADVSAKTNADKSPLDLAIDLEHMEIIKYLIDERGVKYGGDIYSAAEAGHLVMVKYLVEVKKLNPDIRDKDGANPLHWAASGGQLNVVKYLIEERGQSVEPIDSTGNNALHWAADEGRLNTFKYLAERGADINAKTEDDETPLDMANAKGYLEVIRYLISVRGAAYESNIIAAAQDGQLGVIKYLIEVKGQSVNSRDASGGTPLHKAVDFGRMKMVKYLVDEKHADLNAQNKKKLTPLHAAAEKGNLDILRYLAEKGANVKAKDGSGRTPLNIAIKGGHSEMIKYLTNKNRRNVRSIDYHPHGLNTISPSDTTNLRGSSEGGIFGDVMRNDGTDFVRRELALASVLISQRAIPGGAKSNSNDNEFREPSVTESRSGNSFDLNGTLLVLTLLSKLPIIGRFFPEMKLARTGGFESSAPISLAESMDHATKVTERFEKILNKSTIQLNVPARDLQLDSFALTSELAHHLRRGKKFSELSKSLYSHAERASNNPKLIDQVRVKLSYLAETLEVSRSSDRLAARPREIGENPPTHDTLQNMLRRDLAYLSPPSGTRITMMVNANGELGKL